MNYDCDRSAALLDGRCRKCLYLLPTPISPVADGAPRMCPECGVQTGDARFGGPSKRALCFSFLLWTVAFVLACALGWLAASAWLRVVSPAIAGAGATFSFLMLSDRVGDSLLAGAYCALGAFPTLLAALRCHTRLPARQYSQCWILFPAVLSAMLGVSLFATTASSSTRSDPNFQMILLPGVVLLATSTAGMFGMTACSYRIRRAISKT